MTQSAENSVPVGTTTVYNLAANHRASVSCYTIDTGVNIACITKSIMNADAGDQLNLKGFLTGRQGVQQALNYKLADRVRVDQGRTGCSVVRFL
jgi:hypothetical protein